MAFFPRPRKSKKKALKREEVLPFRSNWREQQTRRREWPGLTAFSRASCAYALSLGARNALSRMPAYYYGVGHRACSRVSLSRRKATDQVNIANRCIVASVNSISRPTDPAWLRSLPLSHPHTQPVTIHVFPLFLFFAFREERSLPIDLESKKFTKVSSSRVRYENYGDRTNGLCHAF